MNKKIVGLILGLVLMAECLAKVELMVFVSFSLPERVLVGLSKDVGMVDGGLVLRGLVNDSFKDTVSSINGVASKSKWGMSIDPDRFKELDIRVAPTFVLADVGIDGSIKSFDKVAGNISLDYALTEISKRGEHHGDALILLDKLRGMRG